MKGYIYYRIARNLIFTKHEDVEVAFTIPIAKELSSGNLGLKYYQDMVGENFKKSYKRKFIIGKLIYDDAWEEWLQLC